MLLSSPIPANRSSEIIFASPLSRTLRFSKNFRDDLATDTVYNLARDEINSIISSREIKVLSFDVFDTALVRGPQCEARRFFEVSRAFAAGQKFSTEDAFISRIAAAKAAYSITTAADDGTREGTFSIIASLVCDQLQVPEMSEQYLAFELAYEARTLTPNPLIAKIIRDYPHLSIVFISDMYFGSECIKAMLSDAYGEVEIYSSADGNGSKRSGGLLKYVSQHTGISLQNFLHFGDSLEGDFRAIRKLGGNSMYLPLPDAERRAREECYLSLEAQLAPSGLHLPSRLSFNC